MIAVDTNVLARPRENRAFVRRQDTSFGRALCDLWDWGAVFPDCLILSESAASGHEPVTFDKGLSQAIGARLPRG